MNKINLKAGALLSPVPPVLVTCGSGEKTNIITIGWTGIVSTNPPTTYISVRPERYSYNIIKESGEFAINLASAKLVRSVDFCGVKSGAETDKFKETGLTPIAAKELACPIIEECPVSLECKVKSITELGSHSMFLAEIVSVDVDEAIIEKNGRYAFDKADLLAYCHGEYFRLGEKLGFFGFSVQKKKKSKKRRRA